MAVKYVEKKTNVKINQSSILQLFIATRGKFICLFNSSIFVGEELKIPVIEFLTRDQKNLAENDYGNLAENVHFYGSMSFVLFYEN